MNNSFKVTTPKESIHKLAAIKFLNEMQQSLQDSDLPLQKSLQAIITRLWEVICGIKSINEMNVKMASIIDLYSKNNLIMRTLLEMNIHYTIYDIEFIRAHNQSAAVLLEQAFSSQYQPAAPRTH